MIFAEITKRNYMSVSVTLKSYFYEVLIPSSQKNTSSPIEDILHHVSISFMKKLALYKCFNPRTHTGCDGSSPRLPLRSKCFNPRTHTGCDAEISGRIEALSEFQSTHPHGVRHYELKVTDGDAVFQSTHPHGVRLGEVWFCWLGRHGGFNPRTHTGCDSRSYTQHVFIMVSIHAPTRGATLHGPVLRRGIRVSIHAPTRGATLR